MTLSYNKFTIGVSCGGCADYDDGVDLRCTVCGAATPATDCLRLDDAMEWAEMHECAPLAVT